MQIASTKVESLKQQAQQQPPRVQSINATPKPEAKARFQSLLNRTKVNTRTVGLKPKNINPKEVKSNKEEEVSPELMAMRNEFSQDDLTNAFLAYAEGIKDDRPSIEAIVTASTPVKKDNFVVEFFIEHNAAKSQFDSIKSELLGFVKKRLNNYAIEIHEVINAEKTTKRIFSGKEKFEAMAEKNEALWRLRKELDLDIEF